MTVGAKRGSKYGVGNLRGSRRNNKRIGDWEVSQYKEEPMERRQSVRSYDRPMSEEPKRTTNWDTSSKEEEEDPQVQPKAMTMNMCLIKAK